MILLFGPKANKSGASQKNSNVKNHPVENSGILSMNPYEAKSLLSMGEYDTYIFTSPVAINYALYANYESDSEDGIGFMSDFSAAVAMLGDGGFADCGGFSDCGAASCSCGSFSSVG